MSDRSLAEDGRALGRGLAGRAVSGAKLTIVGQWTKLSAQVLSVVILARLLEPEDFGLFAMVVAITGFASVIGDLGLSTAAIQSKHLTHRQSTNLFWINTLVGVIAAAMLLVLSPVIAGFYELNEVRPILQILALNFIFSAMTTQFSAHVTRGLGFKALFFADAGSALLGLVVSIVLAIGGAGVWALVGQKLSITVATFFILAVGSRWLPGLPGRAAMGSLLSFGWKTFAVQVLTYLSNNAPLIILGRTTNATQVGLYERAQQLNQIPASQLATPLTRVVLPVLSRCQDDLETLSRYLCRAELLLAYAVGGVMALMVVFADLVVRIALGPGWDESAILLALLSAGGFFQAIGYILQWAFLATGAVGTQLRYSVINRTLLLLMVTLGAIWGGPRAVAAGVALGLFVNWLLLVMFAIPATGLSRRALLVNAARPFVLHAIIMATAWAGMSFMGMGGVGDGVRWAVGLGFVVLMYGVAVLAVPPVRRDVQVAQQTLRRRL